MQGYRVTYITCPCPSPLLSCYYLTCRLLCFVRYRCYIGGGASDEKAFSAPASRVSRYPVPDHAALRKVPLAGEPAIKEPRGKPGSQYARPPNADRR